MKKFSGFPEGSKLSPTAFPALFFSDLLPLIDDLAELKLTLFCFWAVNQKEGRFRYLRRLELNCPELHSSLQAINPETAPDVLLEGALKRATKRGSLLTVDVAFEDSVETLYFINTSLGRSAIAQIKAGKWQPGPATHPIEFLPERPNIYALFESNIGMITPMIRDALVDAEKEFPVGWIEEAIREAAVANKRSWRYIDAILKRWEREGRSRETTPGRNPATDGSQYISGQYADFINR